MGKANSLRNRLIALILSIVMVLGMCPTGVFAGEDSAAYGTVEGLTEGVKINETGKDIKVTFAGNLDWVAANDAVGRTSDGWWVGLKVTAPDTIKIDTAKYKSGNQEKLFKEYNDSADDATEQYIELWSLVKEEYLRSANLTDGLSTYTWEFDWDGDGTYEQTMKLDIDADATVLYKDGSTQVYPAESLGFGKVEMLTSGATITGNESASVDVSYTEEISIEWVAADTSVGRYQDGWWAGMKITVPSGMTEEQVKNAQYMSGSTVKSFWTYKDSEEGDAVHFLTMWVPLNNLLSSSMDPYKYQFDWNNDGIFEQSLTMSVDASKVTLTKDGTQVYPVLGQVSSYNGGTVTGSGTSEVNVLIDDVTLNWSPADDSIGRTQGWWVGIKVDAPVGVDSATLQNAKYQSKGNPSINWEDVTEVKSFWANKDSEDTDEAHHIQLWFPISPSSLEKFKNENRKITMVYRFDWDGDGAYEQEVTFSVDPNGNIVLNKVDQTGFGFAEETPADIWVGNVNYQNVATGGQGDGAITYEIIDEDQNGEGVAEIDTQTGSLTFKKAGTVTVKATKAADSEGYYNAVSAQYTITAVKDNQTPQFTTSQPVISYEPNLTYENELLNVLGGVVTYSVVDEDQNGEDVAEIDTETGKLTILKAGTVTVKAEIAGDVNYNGTEVTYTLVIKKADQTDFAFENVPAELTWQAVALDALTLVNGKGEGAVTWTIINGPDVATVDADGKITLLKAGTFTIQAQKAGDDCYNESATVTATILVNLAAQTDDFGFGETEKVTVTYNENDNKYTLEATGGQSSKDVVYTVISGDAATVDGKTGVVTIVKAGTVTIQATKPADDRYKEISDTYELTVNPDTQDFTFEKGVKNDKDGIYYADVYYGITEYTNAVVFNDNHSEKSELVYALTNDEVGAEIDSEGKITFNYSKNKVGTLTVTATKAADECYSETSASYTLTVSYLEEPSTQCSLSGTEGTDGWYVKDLNIVAPEGYEIAYDNSLNADWKKEQPYAKPGKTTAEVYLRRISDGAITDVIDVAIKYDDTAPKNLKIDYKSSLAQVVLQKIFMLTNGNMTVEFSAEDVESGIAKVEYSLDEGKTFTTLEAANGIYRVEIKAEMKDHVAMRVTNGAGIVAEMLVDEKVLVIDKTKPEIAIVGYTGEYTERENILYTKDDSFAITLRVDDENFSDIMNQEKDDVKKSLPIVKVNGDVVDLIWEDVSGHGEAVLSLPNEGDYNIIVTASDRLNNADSYEVNVHVDKTAPVIDSVVFDPGEVKNTVDGRDYYDAEQTAKIVIKEHNFNAEDVQITITANGQEVFVADYIKTNWVSNGDEHTLLLQFDQDANYSLDVAYSDITGNVSEDYAADLFTIDTKNPVNLSINYKSDLSTMWPDFLKNLFGFGKETVEVTINAEDVTAGIMSLSYSTGAEFKTVEKNELSSDGSYTFTIPAEYEGQIVLRATDYAGRTTEYKDGKTVIVDKISPVVSIIYDNTNQKDQIEADNGNIASDRQTMETSTEETRFVYNGNFSATLQVEEAHFYGNRVKITVTRDGEPYTGYTSTEWTDVTKGDVLYREKTLTMSEDGNYVITVEYSDESTNEMDWSTGEHTGTGTKTYVSNIHTIDTTAPEVSVSYTDDDKEVANTNYYSDDREMVITVKDRNFRPNEVALIITALDVNNAPIAKFTYDMQMDWIDWTGTGDTWKTKIPVSFAEDANYTVELTYADIAGNPAKYLDEEENAEKFEDTFTVDHEGPKDLSISYSEHTLDKVIETISFGYFDAPRTVTLTATDLIAGVEYYTITAVAVDSPTTATTIELPKNLVVDVNGNFVSGSAGFLNAGDVKVTSKDGTVTMEFEVPAQFRGTFEFIATDMGHLNSGKNNPQVQVVDTIDPQRKVTFEPTAIVDKNTLKNVDTVAEGDNVILYYNKDAVATIEVVEANFYPEDVVVKVNDTEVALDSQWTTPEGREDNVWTNTLTLKGDGDYVITIEYTDRSSNVMKVYTSQTIVIDTTAPVIDVQYSNTDVKNTIDGRDYFSAAQTATITIKEHNFRADDVVIKVTAKDVLDADVLTLNADGTVVKTYADQGADRNSWSTYEIGTWRRADDAYVITLNYNTDANYIFDIEYQDLAKNKAADYEQDLFTVDATAPQKLTVDYSTSVFEQILESITFGYYNAQMTVTITAEDDTSGIYHFAYSYIKGLEVSGVNAELLDQAIKEAEITYDGKKATATFTVPKMVLGNDNQFNGTVQFTAFDRSEVSTELKDSTVIIVDNITPTANITYNAPVQNANGISYYDGDINATIVINEANFDAKDVVVSVTKDGADFPVNVAWRDDNVDTHTGTFTLTDDGDYIVSVQYKDKSGNQMTSYTSNELTLDATKPTIKVSNIKANSANKDAEYGFVIEINDTNLDASSMKPVLKAVKQTAEGEYKIVEIDLGKSTTVVDGQTYTCTVENLPDDGLYTLTCEVKDMSANGMPQIVLEDGQAYDQVHFSINRNGSAFGYGNTFTEEVVGQYYIYSVDEDVVIVEVNVDPVEEYNVTLNGKELVEGTDYTSVQTSEEGEWSKRTYTIKKDLFAEEGEYSIIVSSTDKADTTAFSDVKNLSLAFVVDQTKPVLTITGLEAGGRYQTDAQTVTLIPTDEGGRLNDLTVLVLDSDGNPLKDESGADISVRFSKSGEELLKYLEENDGKVTFTIPEGLNNQVKIICNDCAVNVEDLTNEYNELFEKVTVSQNQFVIFYANTPLFIGTIVGVVVVAGLIIFLVKRKKDKKNQAKAKA